jgi:hypothetical protein
MHSYSYPFPATRSGYCFGCDGPFEAGDSIYYQDGDIWANHWCVTDPSRRMYENSSAPVMPRGKTAKDMCMKCFQVPSSNGVCGCES